MQADAAISGDLETTETELNEIPREAFIGKKNENSFRLRIDFNDDKYQIFCPVCGDSCFECWETVEFELAESDGEKQYTFSQKSVNVICIKCKIKISAVKPKDNGKGFMVHKRFQNPYAKNGEKGPKLVIEMHYLFCPICGSHKFSQKNEKSLLACSKGHPLGYRLLDKRDFH